MVGLKLIVSCLLLIAICHPSERSFVDAAPTTPSTSAAARDAPKGSPEVVPETLDANVKELESLKQSIGKTLEMIKSQSAAYSNINGQVRSHSESKSEVREDGNLLASIGGRIDGEQSSGDAPATGSLRIDVDIPEKNIHRSTVQRLLPDIRPHSDQQSASVKRGYIGGLDEDVAPSTISASQNVGTIAKFGGGQYTALDMAEYVFWTGDEKGVTSAIEEFQQAGLMTRDEALAYLEEIKYNLDYLQKHYDAQFGINDLVDRSKITLQNIAQDLIKSKYGNLRPEAGTSYGVMLQTNFDFPKLRYQDIIKKTPLVLDTSKDLEPEAEDEAVDSVSKQPAGEDYDDLLERLKVADFLYTQFTLEEVIYQLAKVMFNQGLTHGSAAAQQALQKFTSFLETEADKGHISRTLEKQVLDVLIAALTDTLSEHPDIQRIREYSKDENRRSALRQISTIAMAMNAQHKTPVDIQLPGENHDPLFDLAKYKSVR